MTMFLEFNGNIFVTHILRGLSTTLFINKHEFFIFHALHSDSNTHHHTHTNSQIYLNENYNTSCGAWRASNHFPYIQIQCQHKNLCLTNVTKLLHDLEIRACVLVVDVLVVGVLVVDILPRGMNIDMKTTLLWYSLT